MDIIKKAILFDGKAIVDVLDTTVLTQKAIDFHKTNDIASNALSRVLTVGAFMSANFKSKGNKLTIIVQGDGDIQKIVVCGDTGGYVRGYVENPNPNAKSVNEAVGKGYLNVIKDFNMKEPYNGLSNLVDGSISNDFAYYFTTSEQLPSAVALGADIQDGKCVKAGGIIVQPMPNCTEEILVVLEDIVRNFVDVPKLLEEKGADGILDYYFGHFDIKYLEDQTPKYKCSCSDEKIREVLSTLGEAEINDILEKEGKIEFNCQFCSKKYVFTKEDLEGIEFAKKQ